MLKKILLPLAGGLALLALGGVAAFYWLVVIHPGEEIRQENIEAILARESPVFYRDGVNRVGVFFEEAHRQYVPYEKIPPAFVNAIIAAEDNDFFEHHGVDFLGVLRAIVANLRAGRVVQGGSTITQQAAKNLFKRPDRSIVSKLKELLYAWRLEYHYPKKKILEFYANQFYVSGNGRGLGVAARYYFDKAPGDLDTLECAFIAGSVKSPEYYNPFTKRSEEAVRRAKDLARQRTAYVLRQMYRLKMIDSQVLHQCLGREIPFKQGQMQYALNTIMDLVKEALAEPEAVEAFSAHGIDNIATSGVRVITTVDKGLQEGAEEAVRQELSRLDVRLQGYERAAVQQRYAVLAGGDSGAVAPGSFLFGRIMAVQRQPVPAVRVSFDWRHPGEENGLIDQAGLMGLLDSLVKYEQDRWAKAEPKDLPRLLNRLQPGDLVYVHVRELDKKSGRYLLDLEKYPEIEGGVVVQKEGTIRAMVGGRENRFYNRAVTAKRPMGSTFKPLVYAAAMQLGWSSTDILRNERNLFVYQGEAYFPRPDHESPYREVSMSWAGAHSENVASVWLLYHLCDKLSPAQLKEVVARLGLARQSDESPEQYRARMRDRYGLVVDDQMLRRAAFAKALAKIEPDLLFDGKIGEEQALQDFHYQADPGKIGEETGTAEEAAKDESVRQAILSRNFERFQGLRQEVAALREAIASGEDPEPINLFYDPRAQIFSYGSRPAGEGWKRVNPRELRLFLQARGEGGQEGFWNDIRIENTLSVATLDLLGKAVDEEYRQLAALPPYSEEVMNQLREFRVLAGLQYLIGLSRELGVESQLQPVLSFPLGSNDISLLELARAYEGLVTGKSYAIRQHEEGDGFAIIDRIETSDGQVIFAPDRKPSQVISPQVALAVSDILRQVVERGTGHSAMGQVRLHSADPEVERQLQEIGASVPVLGKTGTANRFTSATFAGYVPGREHEGNGVTLADGYVITSYVGYDDNTPMVRKGSGITGALGALPLWTRVANGVARTGDYAKGLDVADLQFEGQAELPLHYPELGQVEVKVDANRGGIPLDGAADGSSPATIISFGEKLPDGRWQPARFFQPYWRVMEEGK
ncbi:MAG: transglycosylase domain-containing protein [Desulfobacteraceae bacterium]|nr:transglycosylase domain-containing protein [Desulfobacteraceae bacterium]